ncbi:MAG: hypothetical protein AB2L20_07115 [Mangrovibacterium sp.]
MEIVEIIKLQKEKLQNVLSKEELALGEILFNNGQCQVLSQSASCYELVINDEAKNEVTEYSLDIDHDGTVFPRTEKASGWDRNSYACLLQAEHEVHLAGPREQLEHKKYSRTGMINRVLKERRQKADKATYRIQWADNIYGDHVLTNEKGVKYKVFLRDFDNETGYSNSLDSQLNKLGTTKHIMFAFKALKEDKARFNKLKESIPLC